MKKKYIIILFILLFISLSGNIYAQNSNLKYYSSFSEGFRGYAVAMHITEDQIEIIDEILTKGRAVERLTRNNLWLVRQALNEWDIEEGDLFIVFCANNLWDNDGIMVIVNIENDGTFTWIARLISEGDFD
jgi:hypothetical protein